MEPQPTKELLQSLDGLALRAQGGDEHHPSMRTNERHEVLGPGERLFSSVLLFAANAAFEREPLNEAAVISPLSNKILSISAGCEGDWKPWQRWTAALPDGGQAVLSQDNGADRARDAGKLYTTAHRQWASIIHSAHAI